jgi:signal transduction histidine kinase
MPDRVTERMQELGIDTLTAETSALAKCWLGAPMSISNRAFGAVAVQSKDQEHLYTEHQRDLLVTIGQQAAIALENSRLYELSQASQANFRRRNEYLATSSDIGRNITSTLDLETIFSRVVNLIAERFSLHHTAIYTIEETGFNTILRDGTGAIGQELKMEKYKLPIKTDTLVGKVIAAGEAMIDNDISKDELLLLTYAYASGGRDAIFRPKHLLPETFSEAAIPLHVGSRVTGVLDLQSDRPDAFHPDDIAVLQTLADQIAIAIDNARSYELSQQAVREMSELDRLKNQFLANMSHELRTPLNSIIGFSRVIIKGIDGPVTELQQQDLTAIYNSGQHLLALINDILDLAKIEAGKMELAFDEVNMSDVINSVIATVTGLIKDKSVTIIKNIAPNMPTVRADAIRIRQVLINLFSNASKFTDEGTITVAASVKAGENNRPEIIVSVTDTGPGITPEDQVKLFQAFSQVDNSPTRKTGGTGLGLSISQNLIQMHGGQIGVESVVGKGSTFYFTLPSYRGNPSPNEAQSNISGKIILAIDDDPQVISLYERYLQPQGYQVVAVTDPSKAKERAIQLKPFAITLDIMMPGIDGWQVLNTKYTCCDLQHHRRPRKRFQFGSRRLSCQTHPGRRLAQCIEWSEQR